MLVHRQPSEAFDAWVRSTFAARCVEMIDTRYSAADVEAIRVRIRADRTYWQSRGLRMNTLSVDAMGTVTIGVDPGQVEKARAEIPPRYEQPVVVETRDARHFR